jgi:2-phosphosulfolactate phosphatase
LPEALRSVPDGEVPCRPVARRATVDVAFTRAEITSADVAVVIDVLRATSTIAQALAAGYGRVLCGESIDAARRLRAPGRVLAGESDCVRVPDFELGNSPVAVASAAPLGEELVLATTNGSPAIVAASRAAERVLVGCLLNLRALVRAIPAASRVVIVCSGTDGRPALEDVYAAGRIVTALQVTPTDAGRVAECVAERYATPLEPLAASVGAAALRSTGQARDIAWCARESVLDLVPEVSSVEDGAAVVTAARPQAEARAESDHRHTSMARG